MGPVEHLGTDLEQISTCTGLPPLLVFPWRAGELALISFFCLTSYFPKAKASPLNFSSPQSAAPRWPPVPRATMKQVAHETGMTSDLLEV